MHALTHDTAEQFTGDVPYPAKQDETLRACLNRLEAVFTAENKLPNPKLTANEMAIFKAADMLDLVYKCNEELTMGNRAVLPVRQRGIEALLAVSLPQVAQRVLNGELAWLQMIDR
jgi:5'-deoxynucleotidase YfbR-like HD superfamily hydrolase